jgi:hypothetical protein
MLRATRWILINMCAVSALPAIAAQTPANADCKLKRLASLDLSVSPTRVYVPVAVDGTPAWMTLNINSSMTVMWRPSAARLQLKIQRLQGLQNVHFGGKQISESAVAQVLALGTLQLLNAQFLLVPETAESSALSDPGADVGALGLDMFSKVDFELDFMNRKLNLYSQEHCPGAVVYWANNYASTPFRRGSLGEAYFPFEIEGKKIAASLSTGTSITTLTTDATKRLYGFDEHSADIETSRDSEGNVTAQYRAMAITTPGLNVTNTQIQLAKRPMKECSLQLRGRGDGVAQYFNCIGNEAPLHIGLNVLEKLHLYFATKENVLYFTAADAQKAVSDNPPPSVEH